MIDVRCVMWDVGCVVGRVFDMCVCDVCVCVCVMCGMCVMWVMRVLSV